jgi:hypothetical protein
MAEIDAETVIPSERMISQAADGEVTQIHRGRQYADEGDTFEIEGETYEITEIRERTLGDLTDEDARSEGMRDLDHYREIMNRAHDSFEWDDDSDIVLHRFEPV